MKLANIRDKEKNPESSSGHARKDWHGTVRVLNRNNIQPRILYSARLSFKIEGEIKNFQDKQKLKNL